MRDSLMLSSVTVGEKQHPRLGGCVRVFLQLFDWNRRLANKKRIFSQKQLPSERHVRRTLITVHTDESGVQAYLSNVDADQVSVVESGDEEEDNLQGKQLESCIKEEMIGGKGMREVSTDGVVHEPKASPGFSTAKDSIQAESALLVKSPGVIGKLMGLDSLPSFPSTLPCESIQKGSPNHTHVDPPPLFHSSPPVIPSHQDNDSPQSPTLAFHLGLPEEELNALISELNGNMCTILSALPPHVGISGRNRLSTPATHHTPSTTRRLTLPMGVSSSCSCTSSVGRTQANGMCLPEAFSPSNATLTQTSSPASDLPVRVTEISTTNASMSSITVSPKAYEERANKSNHVEGAHSREDQLVCSRDGSSELQQSGECSRAGKGNVGAIKKEKRLKVKGPSNDGGKRLSQKSVSADTVNYGASMDLNVPCSHLQLQDVGRTTGNKQERRRKVDTPMQERLQEDVIGSPSYQWRPAEDQKSLLGASPVLDHALRPHRKQEGAGVRDSPCDQSSCSLASGSLDDDCLHSSNFAIHYNVDFFEEYHRRNLHSARKSKHSDKRRLERKGLADHDHHSSRNATVDSSAAGVQEETSLIRLLIKRRTAREAAATATMKAAGVLETASPADADHRSAPIASGSADPLQSVMSSGKLDSDPDRREKLSAGRSEAGGSDLIQVLHSGKYGIQCGRAVAACCGNHEGGGMQEAGGIGDSNDHEDVGWCASGNQYENGIHRGMCMAASTSMASTKDSAAGEGVQVEICPSNAGSGKNTTAAMLQDVISALNGSALCSPVTPARRRRHQQNHRHLFSDDDGSAPSTGDGNDTESTSESGSCWAAASQPSPVSVLEPAFDDDVSPAGQDGCWIQSEDEYVAALLATTSENGKTSFPPAKLFEKLEERVIPTWPDSEVPPTRGYRRLVFDCVCEAIGQAVEGRDNRRGKARVLFEEMCRWRRLGCEIVLDDLVEAELSKACNRWVAFGVQTREIGFRLERTIFGLLVEEFVCDLVLS